MSGFTSAFETNSAVAYVQGVIFACLNEHMLHRGKLVLQFRFGHETRKSGDLLILHAGVCLVFSPQDLLFLLVKLHAYRPRGGSGEGRMW